MLYPSLRIFKHFVFILAVFFAMRVPFQLKIFFLHPLYLEHKHTIGSQLVFHVSFICFSLNYSLHEILFVPFFHRISLVIFSCNSRYLAVVMTWNSIAFFINLMGWIFDLSLDRKGNANNNIQLEMQHFSCRISNEICG